MCVLLIIDCTTGLGPLGIRSMLRNCVSVDAGAFDAIFVANHVDVRRTVAFVAL